MEDFLHELNQMFEGLQMVDEEYALVAQKLQDLDEEWRAVESGLREQNTELRDVHSKMEQERIRHRELFQLSRDAYLVTDRRGRILETNQSAKNILGWDSNRIQGARLGIFVQQGQRIFFNEKLQEALELHSESNFKAEIETETGNRRPVDFTTAPSLDSAGNTVGLRWLLRNSPD
jgi:PAS domain S-box-containing protein